jgi:hypothetical protein
MSSVDIINALRNVVSEWKHCLVKLHREISTLTRDGTEAIKDTTYKEKRILNIQIYMFNEDQIPFNV